MAQLVVSFAASMLAGSSTVFAGPREPTETIVFHGASDASAGVGLDHDMFIVGDDEDNVLRVYKTRQPSRPIQRVELSSFLRLDLEHPEADFEGATRVGDRVYWITSHGRAANGKIRPNRYRFFATQVLQQDGQVTVRPVGIPCRTLIHHLVGLESMRRLGVDRAARVNDGKLSKKVRTRLSPKRKGVNIEALCASPAGDILYIGFRNPLIEDATVSHGRALVVPLNNPRKVVDEGRPPVFGEPMLWDLRGLGLRGMEYSPLHGEFLLIAGPRNGHGEFCLFRWTGKTKDQPAFSGLITSEHDDMKPEALIVMPGSSKSLLLSDDGAARITVRDALDCRKPLVGGELTCLNKHLTSQSAKTFRGIWIEVTRVGAPLPFPKIK